MTVTFDEASLGYGRAVVLEGVTLKVNPGQAIGLLGSNGSGKSTVLKATVGLSDVIAGNVRVGGQVGYVPQQADTTPDFPITAAEVVGLGLVPQLKPFGRIGAAGKRRCLEALELVGLAPRERCRFSDLSGGQRQRVLVARAIVADPPVLVLDEPFNGLDTANRKALIDVLEQQKRNKVAVMLSTHDLELSDAVCDTTFTIAGGRVKS
ncbi:metal ABC transporter ATP-binding protein [Corynebacterium mayonis]|uniref:metal ABC transporter ATP-binding protein n=1 Tax=Corynebacterium mayonis TaxID=3062461 RepID=UPI0031405207